MKRNLDLDPILWTMVDLESKCHNVTGSCIVRTAVLEFIARTHQTRIPTLFKNEDIISRYQKLLRLLMSKSTDPATVQECEKFLGIPSDHLLLELMAHVLVLLDDQRDLLLHRANIPYRKKATPK